MGMMGWVRDGEGARANGSWLLYSCCRVVWFHCRTALLLFLDLHDRLSVCVYRTDTRWVFLYMFGYLFCVWRISWVKKNERNDGKHTHSLIFHLAKKDFRHLADYIPNRLILGIGPNARQNMCRVFSATTFDYLLEDRLWTISLFDNNTQYCSKIIHAITFFLLNCSANCYRQNWFRVFHYTYTKYSSEKIANVHNTDGAVAIIHIFKTIFIDMLFTIFYWNRCNFYDLVL